MSAQDDAGVVRRAYDAFSRGDMATLTKLIAADAEWHVAGRNRLSGHKRGRDEIFVYFQALGTMNVKVELHDIVANDEHVVGLHRATGEWNGKSLRQRVAIAFHVRSGQIREAWEQGDDTRLLDEYVE